MQERQNKILVIEDESGIRDGLVDNLCLEGYKVFSADNGTEGINIFQNEKPHLVILDLMLPGLDGLEVCKKIKSINTETPIIILTAKSSEVDKVLGLELGADDYLTKPFGMRELFARVKVLFRRYTNSTTQETIQSNQTDEINFGKVFIDFKTYRALRNGKEIELSAKEFELIKFLVSQPDVPVTRDQLLDKVWGYNNYPTTRTVDNFIARLRSKLEEKADKPKHFLTVHGVGYKFIP